MPDAITTFAQRVGPAPPRMLYEDPAAYPQSAYFRNSQQIGERLSSDYEKYKVIIREAKTNMQG